MTIPAPYHTSERYHIMPSKRFDMPSRHFDARHSAPLAGLSPPMTMIKDLRSMAIKEAANPSPRRHYSQAPYPMSPVATVVACLAAIGLAWVY